MYIIIYYCLCLLIFNNFCDLGAVIFVDYKFKGERADDCIVYELLRMGAKVGKTFNRKVITLIQ